MKDRVKKFVLPFVFGVLGMGIFELAKIAYVDHQQLKAIVAFLNQATAAHVTKSEAK